MPFPPPDATHPVPAQWASRTRATTDIKRASELKYSAPRQSTFESLSEHDVAAVREDLPNVPLARSPAAAVRATGRRGPPRSPRPQELCILKGLQHHAVTRCYEAFLCARPAPPSRGPAPQARRHRQLADG